VSGDEQIALVKGFWAFWGGDLVAKLNDERFVALAREAEKSTIGNDWEFVADEGTQSLGMTSGQKGIEGFLVIWRRWIEAFESWEGNLDGTPVLLDRERVLARIRVKARSNVGADIEFQSGLVYSFDGGELRRIVSYRTWEEALAGAGISAEQAERLERKAAGARQPG
jgi:hypothetical protein